MKVGDAQRKQVIVTQNLGRPYIFIMFDENKIPTIICSDAVTTAMAENATQDIAKLTNKIKFDAERG